jgi:hypothetical protein
MNDTLFLVALIIAGIIVVIFVPRFFLKRAFTKVIEIFRYHNATTNKNARTIAELGLNPPSWSERIFRMRDYKPQALDLLRRADIVQETEDGRLYLSEDNLASSGIERR